MDKGIELGKCELCGEPMPPGEEMFKFHGYSGPCPKPPITKPQRAFAESEVLMFLGYLSGVLTELSGVEVPKLQAAWEAFVVERDLQAQQKAGAGLVAEAKPPREYPGDATDRAE